MGLYSRLCIGVLPGRWRSSASLQNCYVELLPGDVAVRAQLQRTPMLFFLAIQVQVTSLS